MNLPTPPEHRESNGTPTRLGLAERFGASWWLGLILAIPLSIVGNLLTPPAQSWFESRTVASARAALENQRGERIRLIALARDSAALHAEMLAAVIKSALYLAALGLLNYPLMMLSTIQTYLFQGAGDRSPGKRWLLLVRLTGSLRLFQALVNIVVFLIIFNTCSGALSTFEQVSQLRAAGIP